MAGLGMIAWSEGATGEDSLLSYNVLPGFFHAVPEASLHLEARRTGLYNVMMPPSPLSQHPLIPSSVFIRSPYLALANTCLHLLIAYSALEIFASY